MLRASAIALSIALMPVTAFAEDAFDKAERTMKAFEDVFGVTKGKRRNHTKGFCIIGSFEPQDAAILKYTNSPIFTQTSSVNGRVSHKGGNNKAADNKFADYGLAFEITTPDDDTHIIGMNTEHFFPVSTPEAFSKLMQAKAIGKEAVKAFAANSPELKAHKAYHSARDKTLRPYEGATYNSINTFYLVDDAGKRTAIRWSFVPSNDQKVVLDPSENFFFENMQANLDAGEVAWDMIITIANPDDEILNPAILWTGEHTQIKAAKLIVNSISTEAEGECDPLNYDPLILTDGFEPSEDPMLEARSAIYAIGVSKRLGEKE
ncbi:catalase [Amylibacter sp. SFDW26]|uniref:catalase n=1 Tax=Amylibacter sp. SFDW26 TaxID=2652722 RepID=UPI00126216C7|nr:catalase [Amylibacter sp. SFDW26]KAB7615552.1 catalase [Amylibacter sp. SFDW26]